MMRIAGVTRERAGMFARLTYWFSERRFGKVADSLTVTAHQTWVLFASAMYELGSERARAVEPRFKALAQIKAATLVGCPF